MAIPSSNVPSGSDMKRPEATRNELACPKGNHWPNGDRITMNRPVFLRDLNLEVNREINVGSWNEAASPHRLALRQQYAVSGRSDQSP